MEDGVVFDGTGDEAGAAVGFPPGGSGAEGLVVAFTASGGESDLPGPAAQQPGDGFPGGDQGPGGFLPQGIGAGGVAVLFCKIRQHGLQDLGQDPGGGCIVSIDEHGGTPL